jgi:PBP1b-binding outer membrane lipoprotein LpoB
MKQFASLALLICIFLAGCATLAEKKRMESYSQIAEAYEHALRGSDYSTAAKFIDPSNSSVEANLQKIKNIKIVDYKITHIDVSESKMEIKQDVELQYYRLNSNIMRTAHQHQIWHYQPQDGIWMLRSGWPQFGP